MKGFMMRAPKMSEGEAMAFFPSSRPPVKWTSTSPEMYLHNIGLIKGPDMETIGRGFEPEYVTLPGWHQAAPGYFVFVSDNKFVFGLTTKTIKTHE